MARKKNPCIGRSLGEFVEEQKAKDPEFAVEWDKRQLARRIRELRESQHITQTELAARARTTQSAIARLESGQVIPKLDLLQKIAAAMGLRLNVDFTRRHRSSPEPAHGAA
ncbi:MAG: helix-turn-helix domain-containing protein [Myxococcaceae bacterium]